MEDGFDEAEVAADRAAILARFEASPEAEAEPEADWGVLLIDYAATYFGKPVASLSPDEVHEVVFDIVPRKLSVEPTAAPAIVAGLRALLAFVRREYPDSQAGRCLAVLDGSAAQRLARLLADPRQFGPAKSFVMSGQAAGYDMSSQSGANAWVKHMQMHGMRLPMGPPELGAPLHRTAARPLAVPKAIKAKRKAQRKARKANRRR